MGVISIIAFVIVSLIVLHAQGQAKKKVEQDTLAREYAARHQARVAHDAIRAQSRLLVEQVKQANAERAEAVRQLHAQSPFLDTILGRQVCKGMSKVELIASWGEPDRTTQQVLKTKVKETCRYGTTRDGQSIYLENDRVVGWRGPKETT